MSMTGNQGGVAPKGISHGARSVSRPIAATQMCAHVGLVATVVAATLPAGHWKLCAYALSGWHYLLYALAYRYGTVPMAMFRRDALVMKSVALIAFGVALRDALPAVPVLCAMAVGFALNAWAAAVLGWERTYYGHEIAGLPHAQVRRPPFAWTAHPMLYGNCVGFGTALLDEAFRARWAPLALLHLAANGALLWLEIHVRPLHGAFHRPWWLPAAGRGFALHNAILVGGALGAGAAVGWWVTRLPRLHDVNGPALGAAGAAYCLVTIVCYTSAGTTKHGYATP